jgi:biopolymer transport protein ExbB
VGSGGSFAGWLETGGVFPWLLLALAAVGLAVAIERTVAVSRAAVDINEFLGGVRRALITNRSPREAIKICEQFRGAAPSIVKAGLLKYGEPRDDVEKTLENAKLFESGRLERFLPLLGTLAAVAPLLGFLGTTAGAIGALGSSGAADPESAGFARAISGHLVATVVGLSIGILLLVLHRWLASRVRRVERDLATASNMLVETFGEMERGGMPGGGAGETSGAIPTR